MNVPACCRKATSHPSLPPSFILRMVFSSALFAYSSNLSQICNGIRHRFRKQVREASQMVTSAYPCFTRHKVPRQMA